MKKILFAASESVPFIKTGGLADVVGSLPKNFDKGQYDVRVILPEIYVYERGMERSVTVQDTFLHGFLLAEPLCRCSGA